MLQNQTIKDIAVVGLPDSTWGQRVGALVVLSEPNTNNVEPKKSKKELKSWAETVLPPYSVPTVIEIVDEVPKNAMGKVDKRSLLKNNFSKYLESF
jgi:malonyl-CoA/methylmalonyl-CoA synthetase